MVAVAGVSCRQQIEHFTDRRTKHIAEVLASRIAPHHVYQPKPTPEEIPVADETEPTPEAEAKVENTQDGPA